MRKTVAKKTIALMSLGFFTTNSISDQNFLNKSKNRVVNLEEN
jgi:hypothetical protein